MSTEWTIEQKNAISSKGCNILVSAAAGSGKTAVLVQRVIDMITDEKNPVYINQLLVATFTNAAASEMKEKIYRELHRKITDNPESEYLKEQLVLLGQAQISTIHSFCMNLIRENFHVLGLRPDFDIADETKVSLFKKRAIEEVLEKYYIDGDNDFFETIDAFGGKKNDDNIVDIIFAVYNFAVSLPDMYGWLDNCEKFLFSEEYIKKCKDVIINNILDSISSITAEYKDAIEVIESDSELANYYDLYLDEYNTFKNTNADNISKFSNFKFGNLKKRGKNADLDNVEYVKSIRDKAKKYIDKISDIYGYNDEEILYEQKLMLPYIKTIRKLLVDFENKYSQLKINDNLLDFNDLEHFAIRLLKENNDIREYVKESYKEILVDEYQDTNGVQAYLFKLISNGNNLFMVGDVKQSIYSFRNSNPKYFIDNYNSFGSEPNEFGKKIILAKNFRSSSSILDKVNMFFEKLMIKNLGDVDYKDGHSLVYGNSKINNIDNSIERYVINTKKSDNENIEDFQIDKIEAEAIFTANRIYRLVEIEKPEIYDKTTDNFRKIQYKDIVVLMRKTKHVASVYADVFAERGIPVYTIDSGGFFGCIEIATVMSFLKIIENPLQDIPMLAVMRSPIYSFDDNQIAELRATNKKIKFYNLLQKSNDVKAKQFFNSITEFRNFAKYNNIGAVIRKIIYDTGYFQFVGGMANGEVRMLNLKLLCEKADSFSQKGFSSVSGFISYIQDMIESGNEYLSPKLISQNDNVVNIMSVHKSKGLEFPIVFLCESGLLFNKTDLSKSFVFDEKLGISTDIVDVRRKLKYSPYSKKAICEKKNDELIAEEIRLLYVAMTRAKHKVIITGTTAYTEKSNNNITSAYDIKLKKNYLDMLLVKINGISDAVILNISQVLENDIQYKSNQNKENSYKSYDEFYDEISKILSYEYEYEKSKYIPSKKSISDIVESDDVIRLAEITDVNGEITSAQRGTIIHFILQNIDLKKVGSIEAIEEQINKMILDLILEEEYKDIIDINAIYNFFESDIGKRMLMADKVYREFKFCIDLPADELGYDTHDETILMQGVIDCCFLEDGEFVIIDYKTGSLRDKYKKQIELYKKCLEISTGKKVKETIVYPLI